MLDGVATPNNSELAGLCKLSNTSSSTGATRLENEYTGFRLGASFRVSDS